MPPAFSRWGSFQQLNERNRDMLHTILESAAANKKAVKGSAEQKIGDFYASCMATDTINASGLSPIQPELDRIAKIADRASLLATIAWLNGQQIYGPFRFSSEQDSKNSSEIIGSFVQDGLGMPDRDYYVKDDDRSKMIRSEYVKHVTRMLELAGDDPAKAAAEASLIMSLETRLASASMTRVQRRDPVATYNRMSLEQLGTATPDFLWRDYLRAVGHPEIAAVNVNQPEFLKAVNVMVSTVPIEDWKTYLRWKVLDQTAAALPSKFEEEHFNFNEKTLRGTKEMLPRWKRCVAATDDNLGEALGEIYVKKALPPESKARMLEMISNLTSALKTNLQTSWMGEKTRQRAAEKLQAFAQKIGYPEKWRDYSGLDVDRKSYARNLLAAQKFEFNRALTKVGRPVDRGEWQMSPPTVNAYYDSSMNEIVFPAGILQPPFFDPKADDAFNYGGIGAVIGHEIGHGFDDSGSQFDAKGNMTNWWTDEDLKNFKSRSECVIKQFDAFQLGDQHVN